MYNLLWEIAFHLDRPYGGAVLTVALWSVHCSWQNDSVERPENPQEFMVTNSRSILAELKKYHSVLQDTQNTVNRLKTAIAFAEKKDFGSLQIQLNKLLRDHLRNFRHELDNHGMSRFKDPLEVLTKATDNQRTIITALFYDNKRRALVGIAPPISQQYRAQDYSETSTNATQSRLEVAQDDLGAAQDKLEVAQDKLEFAQNNSKTSELELGYLQVLALGIPQKFSTYRCRFLLDFRAKQTVIAKFQTTRVYTIR